MEPTHCHQEAIDVIGKVAVLLDSELIQTWRGCMTATVPNAKTILNHIAKPLPSSPATCLRHTGPLSLDLLGELGKASLGS